MSDRDEHVGTQQDFCDWCDEDDVDITHLVRLDRFSFDAYFCSRRCAEEWGCAADQDNIENIGRQAMTDGGVDRRDPTEDPAACSMCGCHIGYGRGDEYCDGCARDVGAKPPMRTCMGCGQTGPQEEMEAVDVSPEDEYYPDIQYLCRSCGGSD